jgi:hypothetical protein
MYSTEHEKTIRITHNDTTAKHKLSTNNYELIENKNIRDRNTAI